MGKGVPSVAASRKKGEGKRGEGVAERKSAKGREREKGKESERKNNKRREGRLKKPKRKERRSKIACP